MIPSVTSADPVNPVIVTLVIGTVGSGAENAVTGVKKPADTPVAETDIRDCTGVSPWR